MKYLAEAVAFLSGVVAICAGLVGIHHSREAVAAPVPIIVPAPVQPDAAKAKRKLLRPFRVLESPAPDGTEPMVDFPKELWIKNRGGRDGAGLCVFCTFRTLMLWAGFYEFDEFVDWMQKNKNGGGWPEKLAACVKEYCVLKKIPRSRFDPDKHLIQGAAEASLEPLEACLRNGWAVGVTAYHLKAEYGTDPIYHCVIAAHLDATRGALLDNNAVTKDIPPYIWRSRADFERAIKLNGKYWWFAVPFGPPPCPTN